jgi:hypothetical protein
MIEEQSAVTDPSGRAVITGRMLAALAASPRWQPGPGLAGAQEKLTTRQTRKGNGDQTKRFTASGKGQRIISPAPSALTRCSRRRTRHVLVAPASPSNQARARHGTPIRSVRS